MDYEVVVIDCFIFVCVNSMEIDVLGDGWLCVYCCELLLCDV